MSRSTSALPLHCPACSLSLKSTKRAASFCPLFPKTPQVCPYTSDYFHYLLCWDCTIQYSVKAQGNGEKALSSSQVAFSIKYGDRIWVRHKKLKKLNLDVSIGLIPKYWLWTDTLIIVFIVFLIHVPIGDICL